MREIILNFYNLSTSSNLFVIAEFAVVSFLVMMTYFSIHKTFSGGKPALKFTVSTLIGVTGYLTGKAVVFVWVIQPLLQNALHKSSVFY